MERPIDDEVLTLIRGSIRSIWTLELLLLLLRDRARDWRESDLIRELRGSTATVRNSLAELGAAGLAGVHPDGTVYVPRGGVLDKVAGRLALAYEQTPAAVIKAIVTAPDDRIQTFADAFRLFKK